MAEGDAARQLLGAWRYLRAANPTLEVTWERIK